MSVIGGIRLILAIILLIACASVGASAKSTEVSGEFKWKGLDWMEFSIPEIGDLGKVFIEKSELIIVPETYTYPANNPVVAVWGVNHETSDKIRLAGEQVATATIIDDLSVPVTHLVRIECYIGDDYKVLRIQLGTNSSGQYALDASVVWWDYDLGNVVINRIYGYQLLGPRTGGKVKLTLAKQANGDIAYSIGKNISGILPADALQWEGDKVEFTEIDRFRLVAVVNPYTETVNGYGAAFSNATIHGVGKKSK